MTKIARKQLCSSTRRPYAEWRPDEASSFDLWPHWGDLSRDVRETVTGDNQFCKEHAPYHSLSCFYRHGWIPISSALLRTLLYQKLYNENSMEDLAKSL